LEHQTRGKGECGRISAAAANGAEIMTNFRCAAIRIGSGMASQNAVANAIGYAQHFSRSHDAVIRVYDEAGNVIETHEHKGDFKEW
jgi:hypothetical protein